MKWFKRKKEEEGQKSKPLPKPNLPTVRFEGGPWEGDRGPKFWMHPWPLQDVVVVSYFVFNGRERREALGPEGEAYAVYKRRVTGVYHYEGDLTSDFLRRHKDLDRYAPLKVEDERATSLTIRR